MTIKRILTIDSGGIKGIAVCVFLRNLDIYLTENGSSLFDFFDMFVGTSTGSLIVSAIAYEKMSGKDLVERLYTKSNIDKMMKESKVEEEIHLVEGRPKYTGLGKKEVIEYYIRDKLIQESNGKDVMMTALKISYGKYLQDSIEPPTKHVSKSVSDTIVINNVKHPMLFKSWESEQYKVSEVCDASSAAPAYFPCVTVNKLSSELLLSDLRYQTVSKEFITCVDGALFAANPAMCAYTEALKKYGPTADIRILSIGCGSYKNDTSVKQDWGIAQWMMQGDLTGLLISGPQMSVHENVECLAEAMGHKYVRVTGYVPDYSLDNIKDSNIEALKRAGEQWWHSYEHEVIEKIYKDSSFMNKIKTLFKHFIRKNDDNII